MKTRYKTIIAVSVVAVSLFVIFSIVPPNAWIMYPCQLEFGIPKADALIIHQTIGQNYNQADVVIVGTITESFPCFEDNIVTRMTVNVEEYLKNTLNVDTLRLESRGGEIPGVGGMWVEDQKIFEIGDKVLLFLYEPKDGVYKISPYSTLIDANGISGIDLIKGIELRADNHRITLSNGESGNITLLLDSFFGYDKATPISVAGFAFYDSDTGEDKFYEDPADLGKFGIHIKPAVITPNIDSTVTFDLLITIDEDANEGKYFVELLATTQEQSEPIKYASWKLAHKQIQVIVENEN